MRSSAENSALAFKHLFAEEIWFKVNYEISVKGFQQNTTYG